ncbi:hypothetical protein ISN76_09965 [Dyella halodurans]|uniref:Uncharacterized protein n=1 Tax=Dyella halodurans TaxID=1920171 RepID=A0ABV9C300_9GAMM|nr:hypothetical protein [Dyella halodurans]
MADPHDEHLKLIPDDIEAFAGHIEGIDPSRYYDSQEQDVWLAATRRWPLLAAVFQANGGGDGHR